VGIHLSNHPRTLIAILTVAYLALGIFVHDDYGIQWDEKANRAIGERSVKDVEQFFDQGINHPPRMFDDKGTAFENILVVAERVVGLNFEEDPKDVYLLRHLLTFSIFFVAVFLFGRLCALLHGSWKWGVLGSLLLVLSPRIFAHSFFNSYDIAFLSASIFCAFAFFQLTRTNHMGWAITLGLFCGFATGVRVIGVLYVAMILGALALQCLWLPRGVSRRQSCVLVASFAVSVVVFTVVCWPFLWSDPVGNLSWTLLEVSKIKWPGSVLYNGEVIRGTHLPWHYNLVWIGITVPIGYLLLAGFGTAAFFQRTWQSRAQLGAAPGAMFLANRMTLYVTGWLVAPLLAPMLLGSTLFDDWRHHYFVYPAIVLIALYGAKQVARIIDHLNRPEVIVRRVRWGAMAILLMVLGNTAWTMVTMHPLQNVYFNSLVGGTENAKGRYDLDYWGLSNRSGLEQLVTIVPEGEIRVAVAGAPGVLNAAWLSEQDRKRLRYVNRNKADYFIGIYRNKSTEYEFGEEIYGHWVAGAKVLSVRRLKNNDANRQ